MLTISHHIVTQNGLNLFVNWDLSSQNNYFSNAKDVLRNKVRATRVQKECVSVGITFKS